MSAAQTRTASQYAGKDLEAMCFAPNYHRWIVDEFAPYLGETVAEVGAGIGSVSRLLLGRHIRRLVAFEPSPAMYARLQRALAGEARATLVNAVLGPDQAHGPYDSIVYVNVLEHVEDDRGELARALQAIRPGGHLLLFVPALAWLYSPADRAVGHLRRYTKAQLCLLVERTGFTVAKARYFDIAGVVPWYVNFVVLGNSFGQHSVQLYDKLVVPLMRRVEAAAPPPIGKNILVIARRNSNPHHP